MNFDVLIVGSGHAGAQAAIALRQLGFAGSITIVSEEVHPPYERPPLSKVALGEGFNPEQIALRPDAFWSEAAIALRLGTRVEAVEPETHAVTLSDGGRAIYGVLIWAAGGRPRLLSCVPPDTRGVFTLRSRADAEAIRAAAAQAQNLVIVGGGYIGLETAASLASAGRKVTVLEAAPRLLSRVAGPEIAHALAREHARRGVDICLDAAVVSADVEHGAIASISLGSGERLAADLLIVGIGIEPCITPLLKAGAEVAGTGVLVDARCRTSLPDIYAIGDCAAHSSVHAAGAVIRLESVQNANDQAAVVAAEITGTGADYVALPWFWSDQYDVKLQTVGLSTGFDSTVVRGDAASSSFSVIYKRDGVVIALDCLNSPRDYVQGRALVARASQADDALLADISIPLRSLA